MGDFVPCSGCCPSHPKQGSGVPSSLLHMLTTCSTGGACFRLMTAGGRSVIGSRLAAAMLRHTRAKSGSVAA